MRVTKIGSTVLGIALLTKSASGAVVKAVSTVYEYAPCTTTVSGTAQTNSPSGGGAQGLDVSSSATAVTPAVTLLPAIHWDSNPYDMTNLAPCDGSKLYYAETSGHQDPSNPSQYAHAITNFTNPSVILEASAYIKNISCTASSSDASVEQIVITFSTKEAYSYAKSSWTSMENLVLVTHISGCGSVSDQRVYWTTKTITFGDGCLCVTATATELDFNDHITDLDIEWGTYRPSQNSTSGAPGNGTSGQYGNSTSTSPATNGTSSGDSKTSNNSTCGAPPSSIIDGFPTAPCGSDFDQILDDSIGYFVWTDSDTTTDMSDFIPGFNYNATADATIDGSLLRKRFDVWGTIKSYASDVGHAAVSLGSKAIAVVGEAAQAGVTLIKDVVVSVVNYPVSHSMEKVVNVDYAPGPLGPSPFGQAVQIFQKSKTSSSGTISGDVTVYCVDCGFKTNIDIKGRITASIVSGMTAGSVSMAGNVHAGVGLGLVAEAEYKDTFTKQLMQETVPELTIPGILAIGPVYTISAELDLDAKAHGQILATIAMDIPNFAATLDLVDSSKSSSSGFTPTFTKSFRAAGEIDVSANFGLPLDLGVGISVPILKWKKTIGMIEKPGINATASFTGSTDPTELAAMSCPNGISWAISLTNDVSLDFFGLKKVDLFPYNSPPLAHDCYLLGGSSPVSNSVSPTPTEGATDPTPTPTDGSTDAPADATPTPTDGAGNDLAPADATPTPTDGASQDRTDATAAAPDPTPTMDLSSRSSGSSLGSDPSSLNKRQDNNANSTDSSNSTDTIGGDEGYTYISLVDTSNTYQLNAADDGNFYLDSVGTSSALFTSYANVTATDDAERIFHFYNDTMAKYGVSRFRLSYEDAIPKTAQLASLVALDYDGKDATKPVFVAADLAGNFYYTVVCTIESEYSKVFLVADIEKGVEMLKKPELIYTVTGGVVSDCGYIPFMPVAFTGSA